MKMSLISGKNEFKNCVQDLEKSLNVLDVEDIVSKNKNLGKTRKRFEDWIYCINCIQNIVSNKNYPFLDKNKFKTIKDGLDAQNYNDCLQAFNQFNTFKKKYKQDLKNEAGKIITRNISLFIIFTLLLINFIMISFIINFYAPYDILFADIINISIFIKNFYLIIVLSFLLSFCFAWLICIDASKNKNFVALYKYTKNQNLFILIKFFLMLHIIAFPLTFILIHQRSRVIRIFPK